MSEPFLTYLTVFKSRLGAMNVVLRITGFGHQPTEALHRKFRRALEDSSDLQIDLAENAQVFEYLVDKKILGSDARTRGRYKGFSLKPKGGHTWEAHRGGDQVGSIPILNVDRWMAAASLPSTVGAPTPDTAPEVLETAYQLRLISKAKNTWTAAGHLGASLRTLFEESPLGSPNPFVLGYEAPALLRQIVDVDRLILHELLCEITAGGKRVTRDQVARRFSHVVTRAVAVAKEHGVSPPDLRNAQDFEAMITRTAQKRPEQSRAPGVLEHRVSPRLEWLTDFGFLTKEGLARNGFEYRVDERSAEFRDLLDPRSTNPCSTDDIVVWDWNTNPRWESLRRHLGTLDAREAITASYRLLKRRIGPTPLRELSVATAMRLQSPSTASTCFDSLVEFAANTDGVSLSGGRLSRAPENIFIPDAILSDG